jgi:hypothetical protein
MAVILTCHRDTPSPHFKSPTRINGRYAQSNCLALVIRSAVQRPGVTGNIRTPCHGLRTIIACAGERLPATADTARGKSFSTASTRIMTADTAGMGVATAWLSISLRLCLL